MDVVVLPQCQRELEKLPQEVKDQLADAVAKLRKNLVLSMPQSRPISTIGKGVHELRIKDRSGQYRIIYLLKIGNAIYLVHAFKKSSRSTPAKNIDLARKRIKLL